MLTEMLPCCILSINLNSCLFFEALDIDRCDSESKANNTEHHTDKYGVDRLIVRRGRPFTILLHVQQSFQPQPGNTPTLTVQTGRHFSDQLAISFLRFWNDCLDDHVAYKSHSLISPAANGS